MSLPLNRNVVFRSLVFIILAAALVIALWPTFQAPGQPEDEGIALVHAELFLKGRLPYRDFERIYGPGNLFILSGAYALFGTNIFVERAVGLAYRLLALWAMFGIAKRWGTLVATACGLAALAVLGNGDVWANTWAAGTAFALCAFWTIANAESRWRCFAGGFFAAVALLCRCDFGLALLIAMIPLFFAMRATAKKMFLGGAALGLLPLLWLGAVVGPAPLIRNLFLLPVFQLSPGGYLPLSAATPDVVWVFWIYIAASAVNVAAGVLALRRSAPERGRLLLGAALFGFGLIHYALSRFDSGHVFDSAQVSLMLLPVSISVVFSLVAKPLSRRLGIIVVGIMALVAIALLQLAPPEKGIFIQQNGRAFPVATTQAPEAAQAALSELERVSSPDQRLFVGPADLRRTVYCDTWIYHLFPQLTPASYFLEMNPGSANAPGSRLARDVASADWLILNRAWDDIFEPNRSSEYGPDEPNNVVRTDFDLWAKYRPYLIFRNQRLRNLVVPPAAPPGGGISRREKSLSIPPLLRRPHMICRGNGRVRLVPRNIFPLCPQTPLGMQTPW